MNGCRLRSAHLLLPRNVIVFFRDRGGEWLEFEEGTTTNRGPAVMSVRLRVAAD